jgi:hypothetical protein
MLLDRRWLLSSGVRAGLVASLLTGSVLAQQPGPGRLLFSYPSAETLSVPRNAQFFAIAAHRVLPPSLLLDEDFSELESVGKAGVDRQRFVLGERLTPGSHDLHINTGSQTDRFSFEVEDKFGPESDEVVSVSITRAVRYVAGTTAAQFEGARRESEARAVDPTECPTAVIYQLFYREDLTPGFSGPYRLELEAEGPVLGFIVDGSIFLPGDCRKAFLPSLGMQGDGGVETQPVRVQVITATGVGTTVELAGDIEDYTPPAAELPAPVDSSHPMWCDVGAVGAEPSRGIGVSLLLFSCAGLARRPRWLRAAGP